MPRSNRRCAASLHEVSKWTAPSRCSAASCAAADCAIPAARTAEKAAASEDLSMVASVCCSDRDECEYAGSYSSKGVVAQQFAFLLTRRCVRIELAAAIC